MVKDIDIIDGQIGDKGSYDVEFKEGKLVASLAYKGPADIAGVLSVELPAISVLDALAKAIPGTLDDKLFDLLKSALESK